MNVKPILLLGALVILLPIELNAQYNDPGSVTYVFQFLLILFGFFIFYFQNIRLCITRIWKKVWRRDPPQ
jgi:hypothetical protein